MVKIVSCHGLDLRSFNDYDDFNPDGIDFSILREFEKKRQEKEDMFSFPKPAKLKKVVVGKPVKVKK